MTTVHSISIPMQDPWTS